MYAVHPLGRPTYALPALAAVRASDDEAQLAILNFRFWPFDSAAIGGHVDIRFRLDGRATATANEVYWFCH